MDEQSIIVEDLVKKYGDFIALDHISFDVKSGEVSDFLDLTVLEKPQQLRYSRV